jgi:hypothetical protein
VGTDEFWHMMVGDVREGFILGCAAIDPQSSASLPLGILRNHGYGILHAEEYQGTRLVRVRNPWGGETEWMGAWSPGSAEWTPQALVRCVCPPPPPSWLCMYSHTLMINLPYNCVCVGAL